MRLGPGSVVAERYRLVRLLGEGGMGDVWEAANTVTGRAVAIKRLRLGRGARGGSLERARFVREAQAACAVEHPNVVEILDFIDSEDEPPILVMELLRGRTLALRLEGGQSLGVEETARILLPVVSAVGTAHARGIVHRDLKPANVFLDESNGGLGVKVLDFGIAKWLSPDANDGSLRTETGSTLGTPSYMAPEQALGERLVDHRADIWALGVIAYECLSGTRPVEGENAARMLVRLLSTGIMPLGQLVPSCPPELAALVTRMLSRDPSQRPTSLREVQGVLGAFTPARAPDFANPAVALAALPPELTTSTTLPALATSPRTVARRRPIVPIALGALALAAVAASFGLFRTPTPPSPTALAHVAAPAPAPEAESPPTPGPKAAPEPESPRPSGPRAKQSPGLAPHKPRRTPAQAPAPAPASTPPVAKVGLASGAACERSRDCESRLCLAFSCK